MTLTRAVAPPVTRRHAPRARRVITAALLVAAGVVGQQVADAIVAIARTAGPRASAEYEIWVVLDEHAPQIRGASCAVALEDLQAAVGRFELRDPWEHPYATMCTMEAGHAVLFVASAGPDGLLGTSDDIVGGRRVGP